MTLKDFDQLLDRKLKIRLGQMVDEQHESLVAIFSATTTTDKDLEHLRGGIEP